MREVKRHQGVWRRWVRKRHSWWERLHWILRVVHGIVVRIVPVRWLDEINEGGQIRDMPMAVANSGEGNWVR